ncbi:MAG: hypothetical protein VYD54_08215 [Bdellovibrionota bacterium]|nr:hypothetical protein [Bdellovibrionota bacterium]
MSDLIIYNGRKETVNNQFLSHLKKNHITFILVETLEDLIKNLKSQTFKGIHLYLGEIFQDKLFSLITKSKVYSSNRNLSLTIQFSHYYKAEFKRALLAGAKWIFVDPINSKELFNAIKGSLDNFLPPIKTKEFERNITPLPCKISIFGRIGKIHKNPLGDLHVESNINLKSGDKIKIESNFKRNTEQDQHVYVKNRVTDDIYYNFDYSYTLTSTPFFEENYNKKIEEEREKRVAQWIEKSKSDLVIPKTKVLFIGEPLSQQIEEGIEKKIFSLYNISPFQINEPFLQRINPKIIYLEKSSEECDLTLQNWMKKPTGEERLFLTNYKNNSTNATYLPIEGQKEFCENFTKVSEDLLRKRVSSSLENFHYLNRKSYSSRCSLDFTGLLLDATSYYTLVLSPHDVALGSIILLEGNTSSNEQNFEVFIKVLYVEKSKIQFNIYGQILPLSEKKNQLFYPSSSPPTLFSKNWIEKYESSRPKGKKIHLISKMLNKIILILSFLSLIIWAIYAIITIFRK